MGFKEIKIAANDFIKDNFKGEGKIVELQKSKDLWYCNFEIIEESDYARKFGKTDIIGTYLVEIDDTGEILGFKRKALRERCDIYIEVDDIDEKRG